MNEQGWDAEPTSGNGIYLKIEPNTKVRMRVVGMPITFTETYKDGTRKDKWAVKALVKHPSEKKGEVGLREVKGFAFGVSIFKSIQALWRNEEWGDPGEYDITVERVGSDMDTKYTVVPSPKAPLSEGDKAILEANPLDLVKMYVKEGEYDAFA